MTCLVFLLCSQLLMFPIWPSHTLITGDLCRLFPPVKVAKIFKVQKWQYTDTHSHTYIQQECLEDRMKKMIKLYNRLCSSANLSALNKRLVTCRLYTKIVKNKNEHNILQYKVCYKWENLCKKQKYICI